MKKALLSTLIIAAYILLAILIWWTWFTNTEEALFYIGGVPVNEKPIYIGTIPVTNNTIYGIASYCFLFGFGSLPYFFFGNKKVQNRIEKMWWMIIISVIYLGAFLFLLPIILPILASLVAIVLCAYYYSTTIFVLIIASFCISVFSYITIIF